MHEVGFSEVGGHAVAVEGLLGLALQRQTLCAHAGKRIGTSARAPSYSGMILALEEIARRESGDQGGDRIQFFSR